MQKLFCLLAIIFLSGCWGNKTVNKFNNESYLGAKSVAPLEIPEELESTTYIEAYYPAPPGKYPEPGEQPISLLPPGLGDLIPAQEEK